MPQLAENKLVIACSTSFLLFQSSLRVYLGNFIFKDCVSKVFFQMILALKQGKHHSLVFNVFLEWHNSNTKAQCSRTSTETSRETSSPPSSNLII